MALFPCRRAVTPGTGSSWLSSTSPLIVVWVSGPGASALSTNTAGDSARPSNDAVTVLLLIPSEGPSRRTADAWPSVSVVVVNVAAPAMAPLPAVTSYVTCTSGTGFPRVSVTSVMRGTGRFVPAAPVWLPPDTATMRCGSRLVAVAQKTTDPGTPSTLACTC